MHQTDAICVTATFGNIEDARFAAKDAVKHHLAACAQILPAIESCYIWEDEYVQKYETMLVFKTEEKNFKGLESLIRRYNRYVVPEIVAMPISTGHLQYLNWIHDQTSN